MKKAFTLIELLVVIAIIAILAAILFPVFAQAKEAAKKTACLSNVKQIGLGIVMYAGDADDVMPMSQYKTADGTPHEWPWVVGPYIKSGNENYNAGNGGIFACPSASKRSKDDNTMSYGVVQEFFPEGVGYVAGRKESDFAVMSMTAFDQPANRTIMAERGKAPYEWVWMVIEGNPTYYANGADLDPNCGGGGGGCDTDLPLVTSWNWPWPNANVMPRYRHTKTSNMAFADGHAKGIKRGSLSGLTNWKKYLCVPGFNDKDTSGAVVACDQ